MLAGALGNDKDDRVMKGFDYAFKNFDSQKIGNKNGFANEELTLNGGADDGIIEFLRSDVAYSLFKTQQEQLDKLAERLKSRAATEKSTDWYKALGYNESIPMPIIDFTPDGKLKFMLKDGIQISEDTVTFLKGTYGSKYSAFGTMKQKFRDTIQYLAGNHYQDGDSDDNASVIIPLEMELEIDGTGGVLPGNSYHSSYLPQVYQTKTVFQAFDVGHTVNASTWTTTISGKMRSSVNTMLDLVSKDDVINSLFDNLSAKLLAEVQTNTDIADALTAKFGGFDSKGNFHLNPAQKAANDINYVPGETTVSTTDGETIIVEDGIFGEQ